MRLHAYITLAFVPLCPAIGWAQDTGQAAFARGDYQNALSLWQAEADAGDPQAMLGLGLLYDRGFAGTRDQAAAFDWYMKAAQLGLSEAQFNVAVMFDAGFGRARDTQAAVQWYTRAALRGYARAQYNLGLIYDSGDGVVANPHVAQYWFAQAAAELEAAGNKRRSVAAGPAEPAAPAILFADNADGLEVVWLPTSQTSTRFVVEGIATPDGLTGFDPSWVSAPLAGSGLVESLQYQAVRVITYSDDNSQYAASPWTDAQAGPAARVTLVVDPKQPGMAEAASVFAADLQAAGYWTNVVSDVNDPGASFISYAYAQDAQIAETVSAYLPQTTQELVMQTQPGAFRPGEIRVNLSALAAP